MTHLHVDNVGLTSSEGGRGVSYDSPPPEQQGYRGCVVGAGAALRGGGEGGEWGEGGGGGKILTVKGLARVKPLEMNASQKSILEMVCTPKHHAHAQHTRTTHTHANTQPLAPLMLQLAEIL